MDAAPNPEPKPEPAPTAPAAPWSRNLGYRSGGYPPYYGGYRRPGRDKVYKHVQYNFRCSNQDISIFVVLGTLSRSASFLFC